MQDAFGAWRATGPDDAPPWQVDLTPLQATQADADIDFPALLTLLRQYRVQPRAFLADASGHSRISYADYGAAFVAELEARQYPQQIITAAY